MKKINVFQITGCLLLVLSAAFMLTFFYQRSDGAKQIGQIVQKIEEQIPNREAGMPRTDADGQMPVYETAGQEFIGLLEVPAYALTLPVSADWEEKQLSAYPSRFWGSVYDNTLILGGADAEGQLDVLSVLELGDEILVTDLIGAVYTYCVERIDRSKSAEAEKLYDPEHDLTLFVRDTYGLDYIIVRCKNKWN